MMGLNTPWVYIFHMMKNLPLKEIFLKSCLNLKKTLNIWLSRDISKYSQNVGNI